jgi:hypothetical protein
MKRLGVLLAVSLAIAMPAANAAVVVVFDDGRSMVVKACEMRGDLAFLELSEGGRFTTPAARIVSRAWEPDPQPDPGPLEPLEVLVAELRDVGAWRTVAGPFAGIIEEIADRHGLDRSLLTAVVKVESNFDPFAVSNRGACGLAQLIPSTAQRFRTDDVFDPRQNLEGAARYLRWLLDRYDGDVELALAAYNAGEGAVDRHRGVPPFAETRSYVSRVRDEAIQGR